MNKFDIFEQIIMYYEEKIEFWQINFVIVIMHEIMKGR